ncbi:MAG: glutathione synthase [Deltaproteobacteria bacterium]|nr:glutathione synthase [Deltaproteobacteria bacterium]
MILSFHPCFEADVNIICAGRQPDSNDLKAIKASSAVILPQGCRESLYKMASANNRYIFPNYHARFEFPGKSGQIRLFKKEGVPSPETKAFKNVDLFKKQYPNTPALFQEFQFPFVFKFDWGGEGETVFLIQSSSELKEMIAKACRFEKSGQSGFMIQEHIKSPPQVLRVAVIGETFISYWRVNEDQNTFKAGLSNHGIIDRDRDPDIQKQAVSAAKVFCKKTGINLAGFDFIVEKDSRQNTPLFLEINYFFGRKGLGGSECFYELLNTEIKKWLSNLIRQVLIPS